MRGSVIGSEIGGARGWVGWLSLQALWSTGPTVPVPTDRRSPSPTHPKLQDPRRPDLARSRRRCHLHCRRRCHGRGHPCRRRCDSTVEHPRPWLLPEPTRKAAACGGRCQKGTHSSAETGASLRGGVAFAARHRLSRFLRTQSPWDWGQSMQWQPLHRTWPVTRRSRAHM